MEENRKKKRKILPKGRNFVFVRFFLWWKCCEGEYLTQEFIFTTFGKKKRRIEICFVFWTIKKKRIQRRGFNNREHKQRVSFFDKKNCCVPCFQRCFPHCENRHWKNDIKRIVSEKMSQKKSKGEKKVVEMRRHWSGLAPKSQFTQHNSH